MLVWHIREKCYKYDVSNNEIIKKNKKVEFFNAFFCLYESMTNYLNQIVALWGIYMTLLYIDDFCLKYCMSTVYCEVQSFPYVLKVSVSLSSSIENNKPKMYFQIILFFLHTLV